MNDFIDRSQWLPIQEIQRYAMYAINQGRKVFNNGSILPSKTDKLLIDRLFEDDGIIEQWHRDALFSYKILLDCTSGRPNGDKTDGTENISPALKLAAINLQLTGTALLALRDCIESQIMTDDLIDAADVLIEAMKPDNITQAICELQKSALTKKTL